MFQSQHAAEFGSVSHKILALELRTDEICSPRLGKATEARHVSGWIYLVKSPLCEAVKVKPSQNVRDARIVGHLPTRATNREWNQPKRKK